MSPKLKLKLKLVHMLYTFPFMSYIVQQRQLIARMDK